MHKSQFEIFKKRKNRAIFVLAFSFSLLVTASILALIYDIQNNEWLITFYGLGIIGYLVLLVYFRSKLLIYNMNYHYYLMIEEDLGLLDVSNKLYTKSWLNRFKNDGFEHTYENNDFVIFHKFFKSIPNIGKTGHSLVVFVISKKESFDFYKNEVNVQIERLYFNYKYESRTNKQIIIQFKKYENFSEEKKDELQEIINFKNNNQVVINLPVGYFVEEDKVYFLRPSKRYSNKYHYYATSLAFKYSNVVKDKDDNEQQR